MYAGACSGSWRAGELDEIGENAPRRTQTYLRRYERKSEVFYIGYYR